MWMLAMLCVLTVAVVGGAATLPSDVAEALRTSQHLYVATKRKDGSESARAPIWFMYDGDAVYFTTGPGTHKATRIAHGSPVLVWVGSENGPHFIGKGEILKDPEVAAAAAAKMAPVYDQKYWIAWLGFFRPRPERARSGKTLIVKVTPLE
jgi:hypothetical protein